MKTSTWRTWVGVGAAAAVAALASTLVASGGPAAAEADKDSDIVAQAVACPQPPSPPAVDATSEHFLKVDGILGDSTDVKHLDEIKVGSFTWGINLATLMRCEKASQTPTLNGVSFTKQIDRSSPKLAEAVATGRHLATAVLTAKKVAATDYEYLKITLTDIVVSSYAMSATSTSLPQDTFNLSFNQIRFEYFRQNPDGSLNAPISFCWNIKDSRTC